MSESGSKHEKQKPDAEVVWKQFEDFVVPRLDLSLADRAVYSYLLRHSRLEGKLQFRFSIAWLAEGACLSREAVRPSVRRLINHGALRLLERSKTGHLVEVRLPEEIPSIWTDPTQISKPEAVPGALAGSLEEVDFLKTAELRQAIHVREHGCCFYCLIRTTPSVQTIDHVVPRVESGHNCYRNLVSCCLECNSRKGQLPAADFVRKLYRERCITAVEMNGRLDALDALTTGRLRPHLPKPLSDTRHAKPVGILLSPQACLQQAGNPEPRSR